MACCKHAPKTSKAQQELGGTAAATASSQEARFEAHTCGSAGASSQQPYRRGQLRKQKSEILAIATLHKGGTGQHGMAMAIAISCLTSHAKEH